jgi:hypothetical protein
MTGLKKLHAMITEKVVQYRKTSIILLVGCGAFLLASGFPIEHFGVDDKYIRVPIPACIGGGVMALVAAFLLYKTPKKD